MLNAQIIKKGRGCLLLFFLAWHVTVFANESKYMDIDVTDVPLTPLLKSLARKMHQDIVLAIQDERRVSLHIQHVAPKELFDSLLLVQKLAIWPVRNIWYITEQSALIKQKESLKKLHQLEFSMMPLRIQTWKLKYALAKQIVKIIKDDKASFLSKRGRVHADGRTNSLSIKDTAANLARVGELIQELDAPVSQVHIAVRLVSIDRDSEKQVGLEWLDHAMQSGHYSANILNISGIKNLDLRLAALESSGVARLISKPSLYAANQQPALIEAGEELPYQEVSQGGGTASVFKKAVLSLQVVPQVFPGQRVSLKIKIHQDRPGDRIVKEVPSVKTRQILTNVVLRSGQTAVLGGIYEYHQEYREQGVPVLSDIPLLGRLFTRSGYKETKRELLVFVTPKILSS